jgi:hypothetical protein
VEFRRQHIQPLRADRRAGVGLPVDVALPGYPLSLIPVVERADFQRVGHKPFDSAALRGDACAAGVHPVAA